VGMINYVSSVSNVSSSSFRNSNDKMLNSSRAATNVTSYVICFFAISDNIECTMETT
jgi:hypothetical protein